jgi:glycosyltransferase involved in cell wall biosynthesis
MKTICLSMIVKNEAHCITRCLESVKPYINFWIVCDTGSTDGTEQVVKSCLKDIPGEFHHHEWEDFATNRNKAYELAKGKADYILIIDADDYLIVNDASEFDNLKFPAYKVRFDHGSISYTRVQLLRSDIEAKYIGVLHEYLSIPNTVVPTILEGCYIKYGASGSRSKDPAKYLKDAQVFEKALITEPDNLRYVFYCAQSYRDAGALQKALEFYEKRGKAVGWIEEKYVSLLECGKICQIIYPNDLNKIESTYLSAYNCYPYRSEALNYLCIYCREKGLFEKSYFYAKVGARCTLPKDGLFLEPSCYQWRLQDELAIAAYYVGKFQEGYNINRSLLNNINVPENQKERITKNLRFCERAK